MRKILFLIVPLFLLASEHGGEVDIIPRSINFIIFMGIIYYLLADRLKDFFANRRDGIRNRLDEIDRRLKESEEKVLLAKEEVENTKKLAQELVESAKNSTEDIKSQILSKYDSEISYFEKSFNEKIQNATRRVKKEIVEEIVDELLSSGVDLKHKDLTNIVMKKVA